MRIMSKGVSKQTVDEETRDPNQDKRKGERGSRKCFENVLVSERKHKRLEEKERGLCRPTENCMEVKVKKKDRHKKACSLHCEVIWKPAAVFKEGICNFSWHLLYKET